MKANTTSKYNKSRVMKRAWVILRKEGLTWSECLTRSWNIEKNGTPTVTIEHLYANHFEQIMWFVAKQIGGNTTIAEEIAQDVFLKANEHLANYDVTLAKASTWLHKIAKNKVIDHYRAKATRMAKNVSSVDSWSENNEGASYDFESGYNVEDVESKETQSAIANAMSQLKGKENSIAMLYFLEDKNYNEIAELLDMPLGSVKGTLSRVRTKLQDKLQKVYAEY